MIYDNIIILFSGATVGLILLQTIVIAPTFFKTLEIENSRKLLRIIFPKFFIFIVLINLTSIFISVKGGINYKIISTLAVITLIATLCYFLIPATNKSSDDNNKKKFKLLHYLKLSRQRKNSIYQYQCLKMRLKSYLIAQTPLFT